MQFQHFIGNLVLLIFMKYKHICFVVYQSNVSQYKLLETSIFSAKKTCLIKTFIVRSFAALDSKGFYCQSILLISYHPTGLLL